MTYPFRHRSWNSKKLQVVRLHRHFKLVSDFSFCSCLAGHKAFKPMLPTTVSFPKYIQSVHFPLADSAFWRLLFGTRWRSTITIGHLIVIPGILLVLMLADEERLQLICGFNGKIRLRHGVHERVQHHFVW